METITVFLMLLLLAAISFFLGRKRSHAVVAGQGGVRALHSLPKHYGYMAALWALLPALLVLVIWLGLESRIVNGMVVADLPANIQALPNSELGLYYNQIVSFARGSIGAEQLDEAQLTGAEHYRTLIGASDTLKALLVCLIAVLGALLALQRIAPALRARNHVENIFKWILFSCSFIAVLTTLGIVLSVLFEAMRFFQAIPVLDFVYIH